MTLQDAATLATQKADAFISGFHVVRGLTVADLPPSNLADIVRDATVHRTSGVGPPSPEFQRILRDARFNPPVFRAAAAPGRIAGDIHVELADELRRALFNRPSLRPR